MEAGYLVRSEGNWGACEVVRDYQTVQIYENYGCSFSEGGWDELIDYSKSPCLVLFRLSPFSTFSYMESYGTGCNRQKRKKAPVERGLL